MLEQLLILLQNKILAVEDIAAALDINTAEVATILVDLEKRGVPLQIHDDHRISLVSSLQFFSKDVVASVLEQKTRQKVHLDYYFEVTSTNQILLDNSYSNSIHSDKLYICYSEWQSEGRGRQRKPWISPLGQNLLFSLSRQWQQSTALIDSGILNVMSLLAGVAVANTLKQLGVEQVKLKWPNDIVIQKDDTSLEKIGGILVELKGNKQAGIWVTGIGLNVADVSEWQQQVDQQISSLKQITQGDFSREVLLAGIIESWIELEQQLINRGVASILEQWQQFDVLLNQPVSIFPNQGECYHGTATGIDSDGQLQVELSRNNEDGSIKVVSINSGEVKVRINHASIN